MHMSRIFFLNDFCYTISPYMDGLHGFAEQLCLYCYYFITLKTESILSSRKRHHILINARGMLSVFVGILSTRSCDNLFSSIYKIFNISTCICNLKLRILLFCTNYSKDVGHLTCLKSASIII